MEQKERPKCTMQISRDIPITQHLYRCQTCRFSFFETCCEQCAKFCHSGHRLVDLGYVYGICSCGRGCSKCHCFCEHPVAGDTDIPEGKERQCTFRRTGTSYQAMDLCHCDTCHMVGSCVMCVPCSIMCHRGHEVSEPYHSTGAYCDCGDPNNDICHCLLDPPTDIPPPVPICGNSLNANVKVNQKQFKCVTCGIQFLCESCANKCHQGHNVVKITDDGNFSCQCQNKRCLILEEQEPAA